MGSAAIVTGGEMKASLNSRPCEVPEGIGSFGQLVSFVEEQRIPNGHVITRIVVDGEEWDEEAERRQSGQPIGGYEMVEFYSARTLDLAREGLEEATQLLPALDQDLGEAALLLRGESVQDGLAMLYECIGVIDWYVNLVTAVDIIFGQVDPAFRYGEELPEMGDGVPEDDLARVGSAGGSERTFASIDNLREKLLAMEEAQQNNDLLLLADLIEYEVRPIVQIWSREAPALLAKINREGGMADPPFHRILTSRLEPHQSGYKPWLASGGAKVLYNHRASAVTQPANRRLC
jgi:hypothetical protein